MKKATPLKQDPKQDKPVIFIAEDVPRNIQLLSNMLEKENYRIAAAGDGKQALEMIPEIQPDLVLLDIMMPEMDGFQVCRQLKKRARTREIPIIFLTAKNETADIVEGFEAGAVDYITKPFKGAELVSRVKTHLELKFAREKLKELNATKDKFLSIIAHDLKNPLQCSLLYSEALKIHYDSYNEPKRKKYIDRFCTSTLHMSSLLDNLLKWAMSQKGLTEPQPEKVEIAPLVDETILLLKQNAEKKDITIGSTIDTGSVALVDRHMLETVLRNLLSNAVKFTQIGGEVKIEAALSFEEDGVEITVSDNGVGIAADEIQDLFKPGVRTATEGTGREKGTGLGLILCHDFIEKNNGSISVTSQEGTGSCFKITLPLPPGEL